MPLKGLEVQFYFVYTVTKFLQIQIAHGQNKRVSGEVGCAHSLKGFDLQRIQAKNQFRPVVAKLEVIMQK